MQLEHDVGRLASGLLEFRQSVNCSCCSLEQPEDPWMQCCKQLGYRLRAVGCLFMARHLSSTIFKTWTGPGNTGKSQQSACCPLNPKLVPSAMCICPCAGRQAVMEGRARIAHAAAGLTLLGLIASWLILLAAVSAVQKDCIGRCRILTGLPWWIIWFQFFTILLLAATQVGRRICEVWDGKGWRGAGE